MQSTLTDHPQAPGDERIGPGKPQVSDPELLPVLKKVIAGDRLERSDGLRLFNSHDLVGIGQLADYVRRSHHQDKAYYVYYIDCDSSRY